MDEALTDFSQSGEQAMILEWIDQRRPARFIDIGAADGVTASNTHALAVRGWRGVCVEPAAGMFDRLVTTYRDRPDIELVQAAVTHWQPLGGLIGFHYARDLLSTTEQANADTWSDIVRFHRCHVAAVTVEQLLAAFPGPYDLISIDTEGTSVELWDELRRRDAFGSRALAVIEAEDGGERWEIQQACLEGWARLGVTENNVLLERL